MSTCLILSWNTLGGRFRTMRRIRCNLRGQTLLIEQFVWKKLSWQPERRFAQGEIRAIVYGVLYGNMVQIWLRPQEGEDILFSDGLSSRPRRTRRRVCRPEATHACPAAPRNRAFPAPAKPRARLAPHTLPQRQRPSPPTRG